MAIKPMSTYEARLVLWELATIEKTDHKKGFNLNEMAEANKFLQHMGLITGSEKFSHKGLSLFVNKLSSAIEKADKYPTTGKTLEQECENDASDGVNIGYIECNNTYDYPLQLTNLQYFELPYFGIKMQFSREPNFNVEILQMKSNSDCWCNTSIEMYRRRTGY